MIDQLNSIDLYNQRHLQAHLLLHAQIEPLRGLGRAAPELLDPAADGTPFILGTKLQYLSSFNDIMFYTQQGWIGSNDYHTMELR